MATAVCSSTPPDCDQVRPSGPIRTCIGCRKRTAAAELLRVVVSGTGAHRTVVPDQRHRAPGRGAWLHPDPVCFVLAERRRAFGRALRADGPLDPGPVREHVDRLGKPTSGTPQE